MEIVHPEKGIPDVSRPMLLSEKTTRLLNKGAPRLASQFPGARFLKLSSASKRAIKHEKDTFFSG